MSCVDDLIADREAQLQLISDAYGSIQSDRDTISSFQREQVLLTTTFAAEAGSAAASLGIDVLKGFLVAVPSGKEIAKDIVGFVNVTSDAANN